MFPWTPLSAPHAAQPLALELWTDQSVCDSAESAAVQSEQRRADTGRLLLGTKYWLLFVFGWTSALSRWFWFNFIQINLQRETPWINQSTLFCPMIIIQIVCHFREHFHAIEKNWAALCRVESLSLTEADCGWGCSHGSGFCLWHISL